jgi:hypothetical protein
MAVHIRHVLPPDSFRFEDKNPLRKTVEIFKLALNNFFCAKAAARSESFGPRHAPGGYATTSPAFAKSVRAWIW